MQSKFKRQLKEIDIKNDIAIFDVDRTIINTTSWYQACITPDLLISKENIKKFEKINNKTFENPTEEKLKQFRLETLKIIDKKISKEFLDKISDIGNISNYFTFEENTSEIKFYVAGLYTAHNLVKIYDDAVNYIKFLMKYYGNNLKIIFLTAGYEPFIRGVVDGIILKSNISDLNYKVIGSELEFKENKITEKFYMSQDQKENFVNELIQNGRKIKFLADDSKDNMNLFETVKANGGTALNIEHIPKRKENTTWKNYTKELTKQNIKDMVMKDTSSTASLNKKEIELPNLLKEIEHHTNEIGITSLNINNFKNALDLLKKKIANKINKNEFEENIKKIIFTKENTVYLRGKLYYSWLPPYIFLDNRTVNEKWEELINTCKTLLEIISNEKILSKDLIYDEKIIIYSAIDNLLEASLYILNLIELNTLKGNSTYEKEHKNAEKLVTHTMDLMYELFFEKTDINRYLSKVIKNIYELEIINTLPNYVKNYKTMRELDNNITILKTVQLIVEEMKNKPLDYIISFPYGGIALGYAFNSYLKIALNRKDIPKLLNSHYSSKQKLRDGRTEKDIDFSLFKYIPKKYKKYVEDIEKGNKNILLMDNNVTTFKTLDLSKNFLTQIGNKVYAAVSAVNYNNIVNYLLDKKSEELVSNWRNVLDFNPVEEYVTAFNTWKTSEKTNMLESIYLNEETIQEIITTNFPKVFKKDYIFKLCRVQNVQDLNTAIKNGVNMIGIHAVYPDRIKYLKNEAKYNPITCNLDIDENLPLGILELDSIKDIQRFIPKEVKQAILFERSLTIDNMIKSCKMYNLDKNEVYVQLQHRTNKEYIEQVKKNVSNKLIITVGLFQTDFETYFWNIHNMLNPKTDYILIDMSKHQPDLISYSEEYKESINRASVLMHLAPLIENNKIPIIIADDTTPDKMEEYLKILHKHNINVAGVDMQNTVEYQPNEQKYQKVKCKEKIYQVKIRKSSNKLVAWEEMLDKNLKNKK